MHFHDRGHGWDDPRALPNDPTCTLPGGYYCFQPPAGGNPAPCLWRVFQYKKHRKTGGVKHFGGHVLRPPASSAEIDGFDDLRPEDQATIQSVIAGTYDFHAGGGAGAGAGAGAARRS